MALYLDYLGCYVWFVILMDLTERLNTDLKLVLLGVGGGDGVNFT